MSIKEWNDTIIFMHKILDGEADKSYGIHVAKLAGIPLAVTKKATKLLSNLKQKDREKQDMRTDYPAVSESNEHEDFFKEFDSINVDEITPRQSLDIFYKLKLLRNANE